VADPIVCEWIITWEVQPGKGGRPPDDRVFAATKEEAEDRAYERRVGTGGYWFIESCRPLVPAQALEPAPGSGSATTPATAPTTEVEPEALLLSRKEAAKRLRVSLDQLDVWRRAEGLPHIKAGRRILFRPDDLDAWAAGRAESD
jgi:excisionase family DNA binding protein